MITVKYVSSSNSCSDLELLASSEVKQAVTDEA